jgi:hypothetical protein
LPKQPSIDLSELYKPHPQQMKAHLAPERTVLFGGAIRGGKTVWMVAEGIQLSLDYPGNVGILCRQDLPAFKRTVLVELDKYMDAAVDVDGTLQRLVIQHHQTDNYFKIYTGKGKPPSTIWYTGLGDDKRGLASKMGMTLGWFGVDQIEEVSEIHFNNLMGRLSLNIQGIRYKALLTANPMPGWVKQRFIESHPANFVYIPSLPKDNPYLPEGYEDELRANYPEELVKAWLEGNWDVMEGGNFLFPYAQIRSAINREIVIADTDDKWAGQDIARTGDDQSVITIRHGDKVIYTDSWAKTDLMETTGLIQTKMEKFNVDPKHVNLDAVGVGAGVYDRLREQKLMVNAIIAGGEPQDKDHYINIRAEMYDNLRKRFEAGTISIPDDQDLIAQLSSIRFKIASDKKLQIVSKEDMKRVYHLKSPDKADSLALCYYEPRINNPAIRWL